MKKVGIVALIVLCIVLLSSNIMALNYNKGSCTTFPSGSWESVSASSMGLSEAKLTELKNSVGGRGAVYYKGKKVYSWGDTSARGDIASASKSILSLILFYSIANGKIPDVNKRISDYRGSCAGDITFHHVANMISGYALGESAGSKWAYNDRGIALYATTLFDKVWGSSAQNVFNSIFAPLNFQNSPAMDTGSKSGRTTISTDDFARIGLFISCRDNWNGNQIIPDSYFENIKNQVSNLISISGKSSGCNSDPCGVGSFGGGCNQNSDGRGRYGYNFWVFNEESDVGVPIPSDTIVISGHGGGEHMIIIPNKDIIAVGFGSWGDPGGSDSSSGFRKNVKLLADSVQLIQCTSFTYSDWSNCVDRVQTRTITSQSPAGCVGGNPILSQSCTPNCTSFTYSDWSICNSSALQSRTIISKSPSGCSGGTSESLVQQCLPPCSELNWQFTDSECQSSNTLVRNWTRAGECDPTLKASIMKYPNELVPCLVIQNETICTNFTYSNWSECYSSGTQDRGITSYYPNGCSGGTHENLIRDCNYIIPTCNFTYSDWGECLENRTRYRNIVSTSPDNCLQQNPILNQACVYFVNNTTQNTNNNTPQDNNEIPNKTRASSQPYKEPSLTKVFFRKIFCRISNLFSQKQYASCVDEIY